MDKEKTDNYGEIKKGLREQLNKKGATQSHYHSLIDDYMDLWLIKESLNADIVLRGVAIEWNNGGNQNGTKKNDSVSELVKVSGQMLKILSELGIRGADIKAVEEDEPM